MKGSISLILIWSLACSPMLFAAFRAPRQLFIGAAFVVGVLVFALWIATAGYDFTLTENLTSSLNGHIYLHKRDDPFARGDLIAYRWQGGATYPRGAIFIKQVVGMPGDRVRRIGNTFWVAGRYVGVAKPRSKAGVPLTPAVEGVIPAGEYFVASPHPDSLDSRYVLSGNIKRMAIIGRAYEIF